MAMKSILITVPPKEWGLHRADMPGARGLGGSSRILLTSVGHPVCVTMAQPNHCGTEAAINKKKRMSRVAFNREIQMFTDIALH